MIENTQKKNNSQNYVLSVMEERCDRKEKKNISQNYVLSVMEERCDR